MGVKNFQKMNSDIKQQYDETLNMFSSKNENLQCSSNEEENISKKKSSNKGFNMKSLFVLIIALLF